MTWWVIFLLLWSVFAPVGFLLIGRSKFKGCHENPVASQAPKPAEEPLDEILEQVNGRWVPCDPPVFVPRGVSPVAFCHKMRRETGKVYHSRRVEG